MNTVSKPDADTEALAAEFALQPTVSDQPPQSTNGSNAAAPDVAPEGFDEIAYLAAFPDVARSIKLGQLRSALHHYRVHGQREDRLADVRYQKALVRGNTASFPPASIDAVIGCKNGRCLVYGWIRDDDWSPITQVTLLNKHGLWGTTRTIFRNRRKDVADSLGVADDRAFGFWAIVIVEHPETMSGDLELVISTGHERKTLNCQMRQVNDERFRQVALEHLAKSQAFGDRRIDTFLHLDNGLGNLLIDTNLAIAKQIALGAHTLQISAAPSSLEGSIIVCLFGKPEFLSLQAALLSKCRGIESYELVYVSNSPEIADRLVKDATIASRVYGLSITLVILPGNAGFGVANNIALNAAHSNRILFINPDVFPQLLDWPLRHCQMVQSLPQDQVRLFGAPLFYDDGSLMHGGMYFEVDTGFSLNNNKLIQRDMVRVEHYGKGAPPTTQAYLASRPVPAVSGAFMSVNRFWFESLGGFSPEYIFGHYEDADLCLKSFNAGKPVWIQNLPFLHLEGKGSTPHSAQEGAIMVNRWHFTGMWAEFLKNHLYGKTPEQLLRGQQ